MFGLNLLYLNKHCQLSKILALTVERIFWIQNLDVNPRNVAMGNSNNNSNVLRHKLSNNIANRLSSQIIRRSLSSWKDKWLNKNVYWLKLLE
jgi:hypothetical protein